MIEDNFIQAPFNSVEYANNYDLPINRQTSLNQEHRLIEQILQALEMDSNDDGEQGVQNALQLLDQGIAGNPSYPGYYLLKGKILFHWSDVQNAIAYFSKAIETESHFSDPYFAIGEAQYWRGRAHLQQLHFEDAYADLKSAIILGNEEAKKVFESVFSEDDQRIFGSKNVLEQFPISLKEIHTSTSYLFSKALDLFTQTEQAVNNEGALWTNPDILQKNCEAIGYLKEAISQDSNNPSFYILLGKLYITIFERDLAIESLSRAIEIDPNFSDSNFPPGEALFQKGMANFNVFNKMMAQENFKAAIEQFDHEKAKIWLEMTDYLR